MKISGLRRSWHFSKFWVCLEPKRMNDTSLQASFLSFYVLFVLIYLKLRKEREKGERRGEREEEKKVGRGGRGRGTDDSMPSSWHLYIIIRRWLCIGSMCLMILWFSETCLRKRFSVRITLLLSGIWQYLETFWFVTSFVKVMLPKNRVHPWT